MQTPALMLSSYTTQVSSALVPLAAEKQSLLWAIVGENLNDTGHLAHSKGLPAGGHRPHPIPWKQGTVAALVSMPLRGVGTVCGAGWDVDFR